MILLNFLNNIDYIEYTINQKHKQRINTENLKELWVIDKELSILLEAREQWEKKAKIQQLKNKIKGV